MSALSAVEKLVSKHCVVIFSKTRCGFSHRAKAVIAQYCNDVHAVELDEMPGAQGGEMQAALAELTGRRTVPNVFVGGKTIGGGSETQALDQEGKLKPMLVEAGCIPDA